MQATNIAQVVEDFWQSRQQGVYFPPQWLDRITLDEGYQVQLGLLKRLETAGARQIGWKVGLTSEAIQRQFRVHEPLFGYLLDSAPQPSGTQFAYDSLIKPGFENEICVVLGTDLRGPGVDAAGARRAIAAVRPALEIIETRGDFTRYLSVALADNIQQRAIVIGDETRPLPPDLDLAAVRLTVNINDEEVDQATGAAVLGNPLNSVAWLANKLAELGLGLTAGQYIMTGSFTRQFLLDPGDRVEARFEPLGAVRATFV